MHQKRINTSKTHIVLKTHAFSIVKKNGLFNSPNQGLSCQVMSILDVFDINFINVSMLGSQIPLSLS